MAKPGPNGRRVSQDLRDLKIHLLSRGLGVDARVYELLGSDHKPLAVQEYATTNGVTLEFDQGVFVNAPVDEWYCDPEAELTVDNGSEELVVEFRGGAYPCRLQPLPGYLGETDEEGRDIARPVFSHADRARLSPIDGCSHACKFCDLAGMKFQAHEPARLVRALEIACEDSNFQIEHVLISGGTPSPVHHDYFDEVCRTVLKGTELPVDVMMTPRTDVTFVDRLIDWGVHGFALNIEVFGEEARERTVPKKQELGLDTYARAIERAVERTSGLGRVRSLIIPGLEPMEETLEGVEWLAQKGCDPVLSPFRPAPGTPLGKHPPPGEDFLAEVYERSLDIVEDYGVVLGPRCVPCQHNTLTFPEGAGYFRFAEVGAG